MYTLLRRVSSVFGVTGPLTGLAVAAALVFGLSSTSDATPIFFDITLTGTSGPETGTVGTGTFSIDSLLFTGVGTEDFFPLFSFEAISGSGLEGFLSLEFSFAGDTWDITDDEDYPNFPGVRFIDGVWDAFSFIATVKFEHLDLTLFGTSFAYNSFFGPVSSGDVSVSPALSPIPLPAALPLFLTGLAGLALMRRRQRQG